MRVQGPGAGGWEGTYGTPAPGAHRHLGRGTRTHGHPGHTGTWDTRAPLSKPQMICSGNQQRQARCPVSLLLQGDLAGAEGLLAEPRPKPVPQLHMIFAGTLLGTQPRAVVGGEELGAQALSPWKAVTRMGRVQLLGRTLSCHRIDPEQASLLYPSACRYVRWGWGEGSERQCGPFLQGTASQWAREPL